MWSDCLGLLQSGLGRGQIVCDLVDDNDSEKQIQRHVYGTGTER
jgi:hypothetical protein